MLSASSPIRDWITFGGKKSLDRRCFGFRGASGIDGTLSLGMGIATSLGTTFLITGDLALIHDINGWLLSTNNSPKLIVILIDNSGGGIFNQLQLEEFKRGDLEKLFVMPQTVDFFKVASAYGVSARQVSCLDDLDPAIEWCLSKEGPSLIRVCTYPDKDNNLRLTIRDDLKEHLKKAIIQNESNAYCNE